MLTPIQFIFKKDQKSLSKKGAYVLFTEKKESMAVRLPDGTQAFEIGIGNKKDRTRRQLILLARKIVVLAKSQRVSSVALMFSDMLFVHLKQTEEDVAELIAVNMEMANFDFVVYKTEPKDGWPWVREIIILGDTSHKVKEAFKKGSVIGWEVNECRRLSNTPGGEMTPTLLAAEAKKAAKGTKIAVKILDEKEITRVGMGGILGVSRGSDEVPRFIIMEYTPEGVKGSPIVLIGKGVTFDTGGLNLKSSDGMYEMHMDMSGGSAVIHAIVAAAKLKIKRHVVALIPAVENMPSGSGYHPGDILTSLSGRTIEVLNTDAEGRIILADAITYAKRYKPALTVDVATLTGASLVAVGMRCSALFATDEQTEQVLREAGERSGDYVWPLPLWDEYDEEIKGTFGDIANTGKNRYGGAITAAKFLHTFAKDLNSPWVHIDMAPRMTSIEGEYLAKGAAGAPVRLLVDLLESYNTENGSEK